MRDVFFHDSRSRSRVRLVPTDPKCVGMYVCGPTVYDLPHLGNVRSTVVFDVVFRLLREKYGKEHVRYVRNITDIDDKISARAAEQQVTIGALTTRTTADYHADMASIGNLPPNCEPRATMHVPEMIALIENMIAGGYAYEAEGHVLFSVAQFESYGALSGRSPDDLLAGARVEVAPYKRDAGDFVLWKPSSPELPGWDSPWGRGRPGWHIECSAMAKRYLGDTFDIHGGGSDLIFPHHENERAQSLCASPGSHFAQIWLHNGMLQVNGEKMSKSLGNFFTLRDVLALAPAEAVRLLILSTHYRAVLDFTEAGLLRARLELDRFYRALERAQKAELTPSTLSKELPAGFEEAMCMDLNTPGAIASMRMLADAAMEGDKEASSRLRRAGKLLGLLQVEPEQWFRGGADETVEKAIADRLAARKARDFERADAIRQALAMQGIILEDSAAGTTWRRV